MEFVEIYTGVFKGMPEIDASGFLRFEPLFAGIIKSCEPLHKMVLANLTLFENRLLDLMKNVCADHGPVGGELAELLPFVESMKLCRNGLVCIAEKITSMMKTVNCSDFEELKNWILTTKRGKCLESLVNAAAELHRFLVDGTLQVDGTRMAQASTLSGSACRTLLEFGGCAGEADKVILAACSSHCYC